MIKMKKRTVFLIALVILQYPLFCQESEQKQLFLNNTVLEPWAMDVSINGNFTNFSNWGSVFTVRYNKNKISHCFGVEVRYSYIENNYSDNDEESWYVWIGWTPLFYLNRKTVAPYLGTGLVLGLRVDSIIDILDEPVSRKYVLYFEPSLKGVFGVEFNFSERFSFFFEYQLFFTFEYALVHDNYDDIQAYSFYVNATYFRFGLIIYI